MSTNTLVHRFLRTTSQHRARTTADAYSGDTFAAPATVKVRWYDQVQTVRTIDEQELTSTAHATLLEEINPGDTLTDPEGRERRVITVRRNEDTRGRYSHRVAYLE